MKVKCPFYEEVTMRYCRAFEKRILIPKGLEKEKYCTCKDYIDCPVFIENKVKELMDEVKVDDVEVKDE